MNVNAAVGSLPSKFNRRGVTAQLVSRTRALRAPCGVMDRGFSVLGVILTPKTEKPHNLRQRQARSAEALPLPQVELNAYA